VGLTGSSKAGAVALARPLAPRPPVRRSLVTPSYWVEWTSPWMNPGSWLKGFLLLSLQAVPVRVTAPISVYWSSVFIRCSLLFLLDMRTRRTRTKPGTMTGTMRILCQYSRALIFIAFSGNRSNSQALFPDFRTVVGGGVVRNALCRPSRDIVLKPGQCPVIRTALSTTQCIRGHIRDV